MKYEKCNNCGRYYLDNESCCCLLGFDSNEELLSGLDKVRKQLSETIEVIKFYGERSNWYSRYGESDGIIKNDSVDNYSQRAGGRRAREFLKSLEEKC